MGWFLLIYLGWGHTSGTLALAGRTNRTTGAEQMINWCAPIYRLVRTKFLGGGDTRAGRSR